MLHNMNIVLCITLVNDEMELYLVYYHVKKIQKHCPRHFGKIHSTMWPDNLRSLETSSTMNMVDLKLVLTSGLIVVDLSLYKAILLFKEK